MGRPPLKFIKQRGGSAFRFHQLDGGLPLEFINIQPPKGGPPLEFINIQPQNGGPPLEFINLKMGDLYGSRGTNIVQVQLDSSEELYKCHYIIYYQAHRSERGLASCLPVGPVAAPA